MVDYEDLPDDAQDAFDEAMNDFAGSATEATKQKYAAGVQRALENEDYTEGLAERFNLSQDDFSDVASLWEDGIAGTDEDDWANALEREGVAMKFRANLIDQLIDDDAYGGE